MLQTIIVPAISFIWMRKILTLRSPLNFFSKLEIGFDDLQSWVSGRIEPASYFLTVFTIDDFVIPGADRNN
jgi:hypothetical protein